MPNDKKCRPVLPTATVPILTRGCMRCSMSEAPRSTPTKGSKVSEPNMHMNMVEGSTCAEPGAPPVFGVPSGLV